MAEFRYETRSGRVLLRSGAAADIRAELQRMGVQRPLMVTTRGRITMARTIAATLDEVAGVFDGARLHVPVAVVDDAEGHASRLQADALVAVGGGSAIGVAKAVALRTALPILAVPTTYSGSELTAIWGITAGDEKRTGRDDRVAPRVIVYDPMLTLELDPRISAASGMNAIAHCVEALYAPDAHPLASLLAVEGIRVMAGSLRCIVREPHEVEARANALYAAHLAGRALDMTRMGLHHRLCHVLGGTSDLPHALMHAVLLPHVTAWNAPAAQAAMTTISHALAAGRADALATACADTEAAAPVAAASAPADETDAARALHALNHDLGLFDTLDDLGFEEADVERVAQRTVEAGPVHPRPITVEDVSGILQAARRGGPERAG